MEETTERTWSQTVSASPLDLGRGHVGLSADRAGSCLPGLQPDLCPRIDQRLPCVGSVRPDVQETEQELEGRSGVVRTA